MFCLNCGRELPTNAAFCNRCGSPAGAPASVEVSATEPDGYALSPHEFISPTDEAAMRTLQSMGELNRLIQTFVNKYGKPWLESGFLGNGVKVGPNQFPLLFDLAAELGEIFCLSRLPDVYVANFMLTPMSIARTSRSCTIGTDSESFIVLDARYIMPLIEENISLERLRNDPIYFMLAHEISHVALGHALYLSVVLWIAEHGPTGLTGLTIRPLVMPLQHWARQAVLSADRGVLVATGAHETYRDYLLTLLMGHPRLARMMNTDAYLEQLVRIEQGAGRHSEAISNTSPYISRRIAAMAEYVNDQNYQALRERVKAFIETIRRS
jgi:hypothetical protein